MVNLFFIISGFFMAKKYESLDLKSIRFTSYISSRFSKLYIPVALSKVIGISIMSIKNCFFSEIVIHNITFLKPNMYDIIVDFSLFDYGLVSTSSKYNGVTWFISILFLCYLLFYIIETRKCSSTLCYLFLFFLGWYVIPRGNYEMPFFNSLSGIGYMNFVMGIFLNRLSKEITRHKAEIFVYISFAIVVICYMIGCTIGFEEILGNSRLACSLFVFPVIVLSFIHIKPLIKLFTFRPLVILGKLSMSIYLLHYLILIIFLMADQCLKLGINFGSRKILLTYLCIVGIISAIWYLIVEQKLTSCFIRHLTERFSSKDA